MYRFNNEGLIVEVIIREASGAKIESYKFKLQDKNKSQSVFSLLKNKYGLNDFSKKKDKDKDIDWLKTNNSWS